MKQQVEEIAKMIDHALLHPRLTDEELQHGCDLAASFGVASVCIKPYAVAQAKKWLADTGVATGTVVGFPQGSETIAVKVAEALKAMEDGAKEIDMVINIGKVLSEDWIYIANEIDSITEIVHQRNGIIKVIFETDYIDNDRLKIKLCELCNAAGVDYIKTSTGFGFVKGNDRSYHYQGAQAHDLRLMRAHAASEVQIKASGGIHSLKKVLEFRTLGVTRIGTSATEKIMEEAMQHF